MDIKHDLDIYINDINFIEKELNISDSSKLHTLFEYIENYLEQIQAIKSPLSTTFSGQSEADNNKFSALDREELKQKLLFKLNRLMTEKIELAEAILNGVEMRLISMTRQHETISNKISSQMSDEQLTLLSSIQKINKTFWLNFR